MGLPSVTMSNTPRMSTCMPSVATKGFMPTFAMSRPLMSPVADADAPAPRRCPSGMDRLMNTQAATIADMAPTAPTERSKPPVMIISSIPQATMPMIEFCWRTLTRLTGSRKLGEAMAMPTTRIAKMASIA